MTITLSFDIESPRGPVHITADLSGLEHWQMNKEIEAFFLAVVSLKCKIYEMERKDAEVEENRKFPVSYNEPLTTESEIMVIS